MSAPEELETAGETLEEAGALEADVGANLLVNPRD